jgi:hypothetical protein
VKWLKAEYKVMDDWKDGHVAFAGLYVPDTNRSLISEFIHLYQTDASWDKYLDVIGQYGSLDNLIIDIRLLQEAALWPKDFEQTRGVIRDDTYTIANNVLDVAKQLGWDASDQDFVQDIIDAVNGKVKGDGSSDGGSTTTSSGGTSNNPKTGSAPAIAVFAVLATAAAAFVCTKKKED